MSFGAVSADLDIPHKLIFDNELLLKEVKK